jgi:hypothetical protein
MTTKTDVADLLRSYTYFAKTSDATYNAALAAQQLAAQMRQKAPDPGGAGRLGPQVTQAAVGDLLAIYMTKDGDTPQRISQKFYKTPDHGLDILQANRLPWHQATFNKGQALIIPRLRSAQRGA